MIPQDFIMFQALVTCDDYESLKSLDHRHFFRFGAVEAGEVECRPIGDEQRRKHALQRSSPMQRHIGHRKSALFIELRAHAHALLNLRMVGTIRKKNEMHVLGEFLRM